MFEKAVIAEPAKPRGAEGTMGSLVCDLSGFANYEEKRAEIFIVRLKV